MTHQDSKASFVRVSTFHAEVEPSTCKWTTIDFPTNVSPSICPRDSFNRPPPQTLKPGSCRSAPSTARPSACRAETAGIRGRRWPCCLSSPRSRLGGPGDVPGQSLRHWNSSMGAASGSGRPGPMLAQGQRRGISARGIELCGLAVALAFVFVGSEAAENREPPIVGAVRRSAWVGGGLINRGQPLSPKALRGGTGPGDKTPRVIKVLCPLPALQQCDWVRGSAWELSCAFRIAPPASPTPPCTVVLL